MTDYVVGLIFDEEEENILLLRKIKPHWQEGYLNGIGGKIEGDELPIDAMQREYEEEIVNPTGINLEIKAEDWKELCLWNYGQGYVWFYYSYADNQKMIQLEAEANDVGERFYNWPLDDLLSLHNIYNVKIINNLRYLIPMALFKKENELIKVIETV